MRYYCGIQYALPAFLLQRHRFVQRLKRIFDRYAAAATRFASFALWFRGRLYLECPAR